MKRVLVFHGHTQNAHVFGRKFTDIRSALKDDVEFVFLDAPHLLTPVDPQGLPIFSTSDMYANTKNLDPKNPTPHSPRGWYRQTYDAGDSVVAAQSLAYVRDVLERDGPFQGIMGFSQGGTFATLVSGLLEFPNHTPHFRGINHPPLEFLVLFSCNKILNPGFSAPKNMKTPTLLVVGSNDTVVLPEHTYDLARFFDKANVRIEVHNGGHFIPRKPEWRAFLINYFKAWSMYPVNRSREIPLLTPFASTSSSIQPYIYFVSAGEADGWVPGAEPVIRKTRRQSWIEVVPKTVWEGGVDPAELAKNLLGIDEGDEEEQGEQGDDEDESEMAPIQFDPSWTVNAPHRSAKAAHVNRANARDKVHFFEEAPDPRTMTKDNGELSGTGVDKSPSVKITIVASSESTTPSSASEPTSPQFDPSSRLNKRFFGSSVERRLRACKNAGLPRRLSQDPHYILVRTLGGREILVHREELEEPAIDYGLED